jgi:large subunit ribosomal protein L5
MADKEEKQQKKDKPAPAKDASKSKGKDEGKSKGEGKIKGEGKQASAPTAKVKSAPPPKDYVPRLKKLYKEQIVSDLTKRFGYSNPMLVPKLEKIVINIGDGGLHQDQKFSESLLEELRMISGMKPVLTHARTSISNFKLRQGMVVGCRVTMRRERMFEFLDRLISLVIPRIRDFRGMGDRSFDGRGNYTFGVKEQIIFPEIDYDKVVKMHGMDITLTTSARNDEEAYELLRAFGFPFRHRTGADGKEAA